MVSRKAIDLHETWALIEIRVHLCACNINLVVTYAVLLLLLLNWSYLLGNQSGFCETQHSYLLIYDSIKHWAVSLQSVNNKGRVLER